MRENTKVWDEAEKLRMSDGENFKMLTTFFGVEVPIIKCPQCSKQFTILGVELADKFSVEKFYWDIPDNFEDDKKINLYCPYCAFCLSTKSQTTPP